MSCSYTEIQSFLQSQRPPFPLALHVPNSTPLFIILISIRWKGNHDFYIYHSTVLPATTVINLFLKAIHTYLKSGKVDTKQARP